jgi:general secretion pathway protein A
MSAAGARTSPPPYLAHWGLDHAPFLVDPDLRYRFASDTHREGLARLLFGLTELGGIVVITGEIGCGKTMLGLTLARVLDGPSYVVAQVLNPPRTSAALLGAVLTVSGSNATGTAARLMGVLRERISLEAEERRRVVVMVDEAQRLDGRALDDLRLLTNPERHPGASVVLLGQPDLARRIDRMPQVEQRVVVRYHLGPMDAAEVETYIGHRIRVAGGTQRVFSKRACAEVHAATGGVPRLVNRVCANALFVAHARGEDTIGEDAIRDLIEDRRTVEQLDGTAP